MEQVIAQVKIEKAGIETKINAIRRGLTDLQNSPLATEEEKLMRSYLESVLRELKADDKYMRGMADEFQEDEDLWRQSKHEQFDPWDD